VSVDFVVHRFFYGSPPNKTSAIALVFEIVSIPGKRAAKNVTHAFFDFIGYMGGVCHLLYAFSIQYRSQARLTSEKLSIKSDGSLPSRASQTASHRAAIIINLLSSSRSIKHCPPG
jgi:hypothetical protein